jgi:hypothetical protein
MGVMDYVLGLAVPLVLILALLPLTWLWVVGMTRWRGIWRVLPWMCYVLFMAATIVGCVRFYLLDSMEAHFFGFALLFYAGALISSGIARAARSAAALTKQEPNGKRGDGA